MTALFIRCLENVSVREIIDDPNLMAQIVRREHVVTQARIDNMSNRIIALEQAIQD